MNNDLLTINDVENLSSKDTLELHKQYLNPGLVTLASLINFNKVYKKGEGSVITGMDGKEYIDFLGGYGALNVGHNHPYITECIEKVKKRPNILQAGFNPYTAALANNLSKLTGDYLRRSFFCNSGAEAVEGALKLARAATGKKKTIFCENSFHGKTFGALSVTGREKYRKCFYPLLSNCDAVPFGDTVLLEDRLRVGDAAAFIVEPVQGEGGIIVPPQGYLKDVRRLCSKYGALLIVDEIQTGLGRTGRMFAYQYEGIQPDIMCLAKSLGGGIMPIGAYITSDEIYKKAYGGTEKCLLHTSTFGGNTYACAAAIAAIEVTFKEGLVIQAGDKGNYIIDRLLKMKEKHDSIKDVRGKGLMIGIEFNNKTSKLLNLFSNGIMENLTNEYFASLVAGKLLNDYNILTAYTLNNPNVIRIEPPLSISYRHIDRLLEALEEILEKGKGFLGMAVGSVKNIIK